MTSAVFSTEYPEIKIRRESIENSEIKDITMNSDTDVDQILPANPDIEKVYNTTEERKLDLSFQSHDKCFRKQEKLNYNLNCDIQPIDKSLPNITGDCPQVLESSALNSEAVNVQNVSFTHGQPYTAIVTSQIQNSLIQHTKKSQHNLSTYPRQTSKKRNQVQTHLLIITDFHIALTFSRISKWLQPQHRHLRPRVASPRSGYV